MRPLAALSLLLLLGACSFHTDVPASARVRCSADQPACPSGFRCHLGAERCVPATAGDTSIGVQAVELQPAQGRADTTFTLTFQISAQPGAPVAARAVPSAGGAATDFVCAGCTARGDCTCLLRADLTTPPPADGDYAVQILLTDPFGAVQAPVPAGSFTLKTQVPSFSAGGVRYHRAPWGEAPDYATPRFRLEDVAVREAGTLRVYAQPDGQPLATFARAPSDTGPIDLPNDQDHARLWLDFEDQVGNRAPGGPFPVQSVELVATLGGKRAGSLLENPNACFGRVAFEPRLVQGDDFQTEQGAEAGPTGAGGQVRGGGAWRRRTQGTPEMPLASAAYDEARGQIVSYGSGLIEYDQTWLFDGVDWSRPGQVNPELGGRQGTALAYDARRDRVVLFGGSDGVRPLADTWEWDGQRWTRAAGPSAFGVGDGGPRGEDVRLAYSRARRRVTLLDPTGSAWEWDGAAWSALRDSSLSPGDQLGAWPGWGSALAFQGLPDGGEQAVLVAQGRHLTGDDGGLVEGWTPGADTWVGAFTGQGYRWHRALQSDCQTGPGCGGARLAVDPVSGELVLAAQVGDGSSSSVVQLWRWDGASDAGWLPGPLLPGETTVGELFADPVGGRLLAAAGAPGGPGEISSSGVAYQTWACPAAPGWADGGACARLHRPQTDLPPTSRDALPMAFSDDGLGVMFGGVVTLQGPIVAETWLWDGADWQGRPTDPAHDPPPRMWSGLGYQQQAGAFWLYGGVYGTTRVDGGTILDFYDLEGTTDLWSFRPDAGWKELSANLENLDPSYYVRTEVLMSWVPDAGEGKRGLFVGGDERGEGLLVALPDGGAEYQVLGDYANDYTFGYGMAFDDRLGGPILSGTSYTDVSLWVFDTRQGVWEDTGIALDDYTVVPVYDRAAQALVLFGAGKLYTWGGPGPLQLQAQASPQGQGLPHERFYPAAAWDPARHTTLMFGGNDMNNAILDDTWELDLAGSRPAEVCRFRFDQTGVRIDRLAVDASAGNSATPAELQLWRQGRFTPAARQPDALHYETTDPVEIARLLDDGDQVGLAVLPTQPNGSGVASVAVPEARLEVDYTLP